MRRASAAKALGAALSLTASTLAAEPLPRIVSAEYGEPTTRYDHAILGDAIEWGALVLRVETCPDCPSRDLRKITIRLPETRVFEDLAPRLSDLDGDGRPEVVVVETDLALGARLAVYDETGLSAATPFLGQSHRWLAPIGAADLDGDGLVEIAYVEKPHLAKILRIWRFENGALVPAASREGFTNHRIGWDYIAGGIRDCGDGPEMILATGDWAALAVARFDENAIRAERLGPWSDRAAQDALNCR